MDKIKVYLAGGLSSGWQSKVVSALDNRFILFNPKEHNLEASNEYTSWDLFFVRKSDIVFAYMEASNPSGIGLALEVGFAKAHGITIILVDEKSEGDDSFKVKFRIVRETATVVYDDLNKGIEYLKSYLRI